MSRSQQFLGINCLKCTDSTIVLERSTSNSHYDSTKVSKFKVIYKYVSDGTDETYSKEFDSSEDILTLTDLKCDTKYKILVQAIDDNAKIIYTSNLLETVTDGQEAHQVATGSDESEQGNISASNDFSFASKLNQILKIGQKVKKPSIKKYVDYTEVEDDQGTIEKIDSSTDGFYTKITANINLPNLETVMKTKTNIHIMFELPYNKNSSQPPEPYPQTYTDIWNADNVKMPNSQRSVLSTNKPRWFLIQKSLSEKIVSIEKLDKAIKSYNDNLKHFKFDVLKAFLNAQQKQMDVFKVINDLARLALDLPKIVTRPVPMLHQKTNALLILNQKQIACLLANAFFCTFPRRSIRNDEYENYPWINFASLYSSNDNQGVFKVNWHKLTCIFNYFHRVIYCLPKGNISFERKYLNTNSLPDWRNSSKYLKKFMAYSDKDSVETGTPGYSEVAFTNNFIGGNVLGSGCTQEELIFLLYPELIVSRIFIEKLQDDEALIITGCTRFNKHLGHADNFQWAGDYIDNTPVDYWGRRMTEFVAIPTTEFTDQNKNLEYQEQYLIIDLNKAYIGFYDESLANTEIKPAIVTGKWGCGAFNGDKYLKSLLQIMAASEADRDIVFQTDGDKELEQSINKFKNFTSNNKMHVGHLYKLLIKFKKDEINEQKTDVFDYITEPTDEETKLL